MARVKNIDLGMSGFDELFMNDKGREENRLPKIYDIPLTEIDDFPDHPFKVKMDEDMDNLVQSIKDRGIITPITLRKKEDGRYEIVSGHRRKKACSLAGLSTVKAEVKELTRDEAIILMVESNLQRTTILPSEKAFSYKMRMEAVKRQAGRPSKENSCPVGTDFHGQRSDEKIASESSDSARQIQRYIRLTNLIDPILSMVDDSKIAFRPAVELSYLTQEQQVVLYDVMTLNEATPSLAQAIRMKELAQMGELNSDTIQNIMDEQKPNQKEKISFSTDNLRPYLPKGIQPHQTKDYVIKALQFYQKFQEQKKEHGR